MQQKYRDKLCPTLHGRRRFLRGNPVQPCLTLNRTASAFTLIELSIVLVIIGLIVGGVMVGQDLIKISQARRLMSQMEQFDVAASTFRLKYNCKAGDCPHANNVGLGTSGNGDGYIGAVNGDPQTWPYCLQNNANTSCLTATSQSPSSNMNTRRAGGEHQLFLAHLSAAGLIENNALTSAPAGIQDLSATMDSYYPKDALGKAYLYVVSWNSKIYLRTGMTTAEINGPMHRTAILNASQMQYISSKLGYKTVYTGFNGNFYPEGFENGQRVLATGVNATNALTPKDVFILATVGLPATSFTPCAVSDGAGGYMYNIAAGGSCNLFWQLDY